MQHSTPSQIARPSSTDALRRPLRVAWHVPVRGTVLAAPVAADRLILVPTIAPGSAGDAGAVEAFDARTGARRWSFDGGTGLPGGLTTSPAVADGLAVFGTGAGTVHAIRASTGEPVWHVALGRGPLAGMTIHDGLVLAVGEGTRLVALELPSGRQRWEVPAGRGAYAAPTVGGTEVYIALEDGTLESTGPGGMRWKLALPASMPVQLTLAPELALVSVLADRSLRAIDRSSHAERWHFSATGEPGIVPHAPPVAIAGGIVCVGDRDRVVGLALSSGDQRWSLPATGAVHAVLAAGDLAVVATRAGDLRVVDAANGTLVSSLHLDQPASSGLLLHDGTLYFVDTAGQLVAMAP